MFKFREKNNRNGVAIIIVLGMLALLMMMGVAFSVSMRIERRSAGNYSHSVATKNLVWAGLARAIDDIEGEMNGHVFPPFDELRSEDTTTSNPIYVSLGRGEALDYIPGALKDLAESSESDWVNFSVVWGSGNNIATNVPGRFAYLVLNCSDFIDANYAGGTNNRMGGVDASELQIVDADFIQVDLDDFIDFRDDDIRYETLQEQRALTGITNDDFVVYSRYPEGTVIQLGTPDEEVYSDLLNIGMDYDDPEFPSKAEFRPYIKLALNDINVPDSQADFIYDALIDYLDSDSVPTDMDSPCTESVPMINEVAILSPKIGRNGNSFAFQVVVDVETFYPFVKPSFHDFDVEYDLNFLVTTGSVTFADKDFIVSEDSGYHAYGETNCYQKMALLAKNTDMFAAASNAVFEITVTIDNLLVRSDDGDVVDEVTGAFEFVMNVANSDWPQGLTWLPTEPSKEAIDPRFNWQSAYFQTNLDGTNSMIPLAVGNSWLTNANVGLRLSSTVENGTYENSTEMYVSDQKRLQSVGELGNLVRKKMSAWQTIRLFDQVDGGNTAIHDEVFKYFTVTSNSVGRGLVNLNSTDDEILKTALKNMPSKYAESSISITAGYVDNIINVIRDWRGSTLPATWDNEFNNVSDWIDLDWETRFPGQSDLVREALLAYSYGLLGTRQNLFAIIVSASPVTTSMGEYARQTKQITALGSKRAIAYVWRDPFPDANGKHKCFVQFFKWL